MLQCRQFHPSDFDVSERPFASGVYGAVHLGVHRVKHTLHAVKVLPPSRRDSDVRSEANNHWLLSGSPHVCTMHGFTRRASDGAACLVTELHTGGSLRTQLLTGPFSHRQVLRLARGLLVALSGCEDRGICHGDVKPGNIMFAGPGATDVRLIDFGSSLVLSAGQAVTFGTPAYAAPEIAATRQAAPTSDAWSAGAVLHEVLTGSLPPRRPGAVLDLPTWVPHASRDLLKQLLQLDADKRLHPFEALGHPCLLCGP